MDGSISCAAHQGPRKSQDDVYFMDGGEGYFIFGVFDGHGTQGQEIAEFCKTALSERLAGESCSSNPESVIREAVAELAEKARRYDAGGTTLSIVWIQDDRVVVGVLGDSPVLVVDASGQLHMSPEHNASNDTEREAVAKRGGRCIKRNGSLYFEHPYDDSRGLQLSRDLGSSDYDKILSREPEIYTVASPKYVVVGSDGLLHHQRDQNPAIAAEIAATLNETSTANELMKCAQRRGLWDNTTVLLWKNAT